MANTHENLEELNEVLGILKNNLEISQEKINTQKSIYTEFYKIFSKFSGKLASLATKINEEVLSTVGNDESVIHSYQYFSNSLLRMSQCARKVAHKSKTQVFEPLKTFTQNYDNVSADLLKKIETKIYQMALNQAQLLRTRQNYNQACQKLEKHKQMQSKTMAKIQNGSVAELQKFNQNMKKLTENITSCQKFYLVSIQKSNLEWQLIKRELDLISQSLSYNEESRLSFFKKTVINSVKTLEEFNNAFDQEVTKKIEETNKMFDKEKIQNSNQKKLKFKIQSVIANDARQEFISYEDLIKSKKKKSLEEESTYLTEVFSKIKEKEKVIMIEMIKPWFITPKSVHNETFIDLSKSDSSSFRNHQEKEKPVINEKNSLHKVKSVQIFTQSSKEEAKTNIKSEKLEREIDNSKEKILSLQPFSLYFIQILYSKILDMTSFYCKLNEDNFYFLLNSFTIITKNMDISSNNAVTDLNIEFIYKMMLISQRVMLKKQMGVNNSKSQPIELLSFQYGKNCQKFKDPKNLQKILNYIEKRKAQRKKVINEGGRGAISAFTKGLYATFLGKKETLLTQDEQFNCLQELISLIANLSIPNQIVLPFIKSVIGSNHQGSYDYLKGIILAKKDVEERQRLFYRKEIKEKKEQRFRKAYETKKMGQYALAIAAKKGFFSKSDLRLRLLCKQLSNIHLQILAHLPLSTEQKWIHLIPSDTYKNYIKMKQQVAQNSVPSSIEQIITLDVNRSLHMHGEYLNPTILHSLLRIYAYFHKQISYCQGMNYIAGYLYIKTRNQQYTYRIFQTLMEVRFKEIFVNQFEILKTKMYQFQRLLAIFHPEISEHFKRQAISPQCYIVSWIITLFASSYQYTMQSYLIDFLWERFIIWGWRQFFKFVLWIFSLNKEQLIELTYDRALHLLGDLGKSKMFLAGDMEYKRDFGYDVNEGMERYHVSEQLLQKFKIEYSLDNK